MRVIAKKTLVEYYTEHSEAKTALEEWFAKTESARWENFSQVKKPLIRPTTSAIIESSSIYEETDIDLWH